MSLSIGIVGLPNVGKSTIFNALTKSKVEAANYPFCTINPHTGVIKVPDNRISKLSMLSGSEKIVPAIIEFVDIAGLVRGASKGEGLGNKFLSNIRECSAIVHILRYFSSSDIIHVENRVNPKDDLDIINTELLIADQEIATNSLANIQKKSKQNPNDKIAKLLAEVLVKCKEALDAGILLKDISLSEDDRFLIKSYGFLTLKPAMYVINVSESDLKLPKQEILKNAGLEINHDHVTIICAKLESELIDMTEDEVREYLLSVGAQETGLEKIAIAGYKLLNLISFLTTGEKETRAWTIKEGTKAPQAAGVIHTDFEKNFIRAEVIQWDTLIKAGDWTSAREKGLVRQEGKDYVMKDGDVVIFKVGA